MEHALPLNRARSGYSVRCVNSEDLQTSMMLLFATDPTMNRGSDGSCSHINTLPSGSIVRPVRPMLHIVREPLSHRSWGLSGRMGITSRFRAFLLGFDFCDGAPKPVILRNGYFFSEAKTVCLIAFEVSSLKNKSSECLNADRP